MSILMRAVTGFFLAMLAPLAVAELDNRDVLVSEVQVWQGNSPLYLLLSNGTWCYVPNGEDAMISAVMSAYFNASTVTAVCADRTDVFHNVRGHRLFHLRLKPRASVRKPTRNSSMRTDPRRTYPPPRRQ